MHTNSYWRSKIPVPLVLLFVANLLLTIALEILLLYRLPVPLTEDTLAQSGYEDCTIVQETARGKLRCCLVRTGSGETHLIPIRDHALAASRGRLLKKYITVIPEKTEITVPVKIGVHTTMVTIRPGAFPGAAPEVSIDYFGSSNTTTGYMVLAALLEALELAVWHLIKHQ